MRLLSDVADATEHRWLMFKVRQSFHRASFLTTSLILDLVGQLLPGL